MALRFIVFLFSAVLFSCSQDVETKQHSAPSAIEKWRAELDLGEAALPFFFELSENQITIINAEERIEIEAIQRKGDSIVIEMPYFDSEIKAKFTSDSTMKGTWLNYSKGKNYQVPFFASTSGLKNRFNVNLETAMSYFGKWETTFSPDTISAQKAIGIFQQSGNKITGTFVTETGDYRFLEGNATDDSLFLSCFDGAHAFLFKAKLNDDGTLEGIFWSGNHWKEPWIAKRNETIELTHPDSLTFLKNGYDKFAFTFPDLDSNLVSLADDKYQGKVVIIQIMGTWCPNCVDETKFLSKLYDKHHEKGLEIIGLAYERASDFQKAVQNVQKHKAVLNAEYDFLIAGNSKKTKAAETLPMLNHIMSYPTAIFIDKKGKIQKIHTGFYGPGTGVYYENFVKEITAFVEELLTESS